MIRIEHLHKSYGPKPVLEDLSLSVGKGEIYGFIGKNGAGKSTTMNLLAGLIRPDSGICFIDGAPIDGAPPRGGVLGYLPENPGFYPYMTGLEYLLFMEGLRGNRARNASQKAFALLERVSLEDAANRRIEGYSRGMRQRLGLAAVLTSDPSVLILDEPSSALDPEGRKKLSDILKDLGDSGKTVFISTHILGDIERICDRIGLLHEGGIRMESTLEALNRRYLLPSFEIAFPSPPPDRVVAAFREAPWTERVFLAGRLLTIDLADETDARTQLVKTLAGFELPVESLNRKRLDLEDLFMRMVSPHDDL